MDAATMQAVIDTVPAPEPEPSVKTAMVQALSDIAHRRLGVDLTGEFTVDTDPDGDLRITMAGLTLNEARTEVVPSEREYEWTGYITVTVEVSGTVTAGSREEAQEQAEEAMRTCDPQCDFYGNLDMDSVDVTETDIYEVSEV